jgi:4-hydroxybenzoate polyprenyltransferase
VSSTHAALRTPGDLGARLAGWLTLARVSNTPTVASNVLAGAAIAGVHEPGVELVLLVVAMAAFYTAGMLLNDVCDYQWDLEHRPDRPLVIGLVSRRAATLATLGLFVLGVALLIPFGPRALLAGLVLIGCIGAYDVWHKTNPLSPLVMAICRLMVYVTAFVAFAWPPVPMLAIAGGLMVAHLVGLTAIAKSEARPSMVGYWPAVLLLLAPVYFLPQIPVFAVVDAAYLLSSMVYVYRRRQRRIGTAVARLIAGISLLDLLVLAAVGASPLLLGLAVLAFGLTLLLQRFIEGT